MIRLITYILSVGRSMFRHLRFPEGGYSSESGSPPTVPRKRARLTYLIFASVNKWEKCCDPPHLIEKDTSTWQCNGWIKHVQPAGFGNWMYMVPLETGIYTHTHAKGVRSWTWCFFFSALMDLCLGIGADLESIVLMTYKSEKELTIVMLGCKISWLYCSSG